MDERRSGGCVDMYLDMAYCWAIPSEEHSLTRNRAQVAHQPLALESCFHSMQSAVDFV